MLGIALSAVCLVHCLALPLVLTLVPLTALVGVSDETFHFVLAWIILPISGVALVLGALRHGFQGVLLIGVAGIGLLFVGVVGHDVLGVYGERAVTVSGSLIVVAAHLLNLRFSRRTKGERGRSVPETG